MAGSRQSYSFELQPHLPVYMTLESIFTLTRALCCRLFPRYVGPVMAQAVSAWFRVTRYTQVPSAGTSPLSVMFRCTPDHMAVGGLDFKSECYVQILTFIELSSTTDLRACGRSRNVLDLLDQYFDLNVKKKFALAHVSLLPRFELSCRNLCFL